MAIKYVECLASSLPSDLVWTTPARNGGQIVEVSYADYPAQRDGAEHGASYQRQVDHSDGSTTYYRLAGLGGRWSQVRDCRGRLIAEYLNHPSAAQGVAANVIGATVEEV